MPLYDAEEPGTVINEFLITLFIPGIVFLVALWATFRLLFDDLLLAYGLPPLTAASGRAAIASGYGRFVLLVLLTAVLLVPYIGVYVRFLRQPLRERGLV
jgi:small-conductance mechanosensitive channel